MGAGGTSGAVQFPAFIEDLHGHLLASTGVDTAAGSVFTDQNFTKPDHDIVELLNSAWTTNPYTGFSFTNPTTDLASSKSQFDLFYAGVTNRLDEGDYADFITQALLAVTNPTTGQLPEHTVQHDTALSNTEALLASAKTTALNELNLTAATTIWKSVVSAATAELKKCDFPKEINVPQVIAEASQNADNNLKTAFRLARKLIDSTEAKNVVSAFEGRRETTYQNQVSDFAGTMADINAVNSSAFMFGVAILRGEQMREVGEFDSQISLNLLQQGLSAHITMHAHQLRVSLQAASQGTRAHNALLQSSIQLLTTLRRREELTPDQLLSLYGGLFAAELSAYQDSERLNKVAKEQRYSQGLGQILNLVTNRVEYERLAANLLTEQNRIKINARSQYEGLSIEDDEREQMWRLNVARAGVDILAAPGGMAAPVPKMPHPAMQVAGTAIQAVSAFGQVAGGG